MNRKLLIGMSALFVLLAGCAQNTEQASDQKTETVGATTQTMDQMAPKRQFVQVFIRPDTAARYDEDGYVIVEDDGESGEGRNDGDESTDDHSTYALTIGNISITEGGSQTPSIAGETSGTSSGEQTPTQTATQDVKPEIGISLAAAFQGMGLVDQAVSAAAAAGTSTVDKETVADVYSQLLKGADQDTVAKAIAVMQQALGDVTAAAAKQEPADDAKD